MAESNKDRVNSQKERIHAMEVAIKLKPDISLQEYLEYEKELLKSLENNK